MSDFLAHLAALDVPLFIAPPGGAEFTRPDAWQNTDPRTNVDRLKEWHQGDALCGVMGGTLATVDVDTRNGGEVDAVRTLLDNLGVTVYAEVSTPGGGAHFYVAGNPELPSVRATAARDGLLGYPGVEVLSHGRHAFLPGTQRPKYDGKGYVVVRDNLAALADGGDLDGAERFASWVAAHRMVRVDLFAPAPAWNGAHPDARQAAYLAAALDNQAREVEGTPAGGRNHALYTAALKLGSYIAGAGLAESVVVERLAIAAAVCGYAAEDGPAAVNATIRSGLRNGRLKPRAVPAEQPPLSLTDGPATATADSGTEPSVPALEFHTMPNLRARVRAAGPRRWLLRGVWPAADYGVHGAEPKAQKTMNTNDLAVAVASGTRWLDLIPVDNPGPVVMFVGEGGEGNALRRLDAEAERRGIDLDTLPIVVCSRAPHLNDQAHLDLMAEQVDGLHPALVTLDPLYLSARGAELGDLYKMGALLESPQRICQGAGAALWVVTHFNRQAGTGARRLTGAGPAEWGRVLITATVKSRKTDMDTGASRVITELDVIGGEVPDQTLRVDRRIWADDPDDLDSALHVETVTTYADGTDGTDGTDDIGEGHTSPAGRKLVEALTAASEPRTSSQLVDWIADTYGHGLRRETVSRELNKLAALGRVDSLDTGARFKEKLWMLPPV